jgi:threonine/homoserine/homoserine lactone efflux protein
MADAIGQVLSLAVGVAISPVPIIAVVLMLATPRGRVNGPAFLGGWLLGLTVVGAIVLVASNGADATDADATPATWVSWLKLALGVLLVLVAVKQWRGRPRAGEEGTLPKWMQTIDTFTPGRAVAMGVALSAINPKNLLLTVGAAAAIAQANVSTGDEVVALAVFIVIGTLGPAAPVLIALFMGSKAREILDDLKTWMGAHNAAIMSVLCLVIGAKLLGDGISGLGS